MQDLQTMVALVTDDAQGIASAFAPPATIFTLVSEIHEATDEPQATHAPSMQVETRALSAAPESEDVAIVGIGLALPGAGNPAQFWDILMRGPQLDVSFGTSYPAPPLEGLRIPSKTARTVDRAQLMILACAHTLLREQLASFWESTRATTGVLLGHMGKTRQAILYAHRIYLDDAHSALAADPAITRHDQFEPAFAKLRSDLKQLVPPANMDSFSGFMPNVIPARVANFFDLKGLALACDAGFASALTAFELGARYLHSGELDLAIVGGINGNSGWEADDTLRGLGLSESTIAGEGAFLFALTRESTAREHGLPILAYVDTVTGSAQSVPPVECGLRTASVAPRVNYMGADSALAVLRALHGQAQSAVVHCRNGVDGSERRLSLERPLQTPARRTATVPTAIKRQFFIDRILEKDTDRTVFERTFSLDRDPYLAHHVVNGYPTLPGTFVPELAAEVALALFPDMKVVAFEDLRFAHFLRIYGEAPAPKRIEARVLEKSASRVVIGMRVLTDTLGRGGRVLAREKLHFAARAILMPHYPAAPMWEPWDRAAEMAVPDPYHFDESPVLLSGVFVTTRDTRAHPMGKRASYACSLHADDPTFFSFVTPCLMMDGLARAGVLQLCEKDYLPVAAPATIRRIDLYQGANDCVLASTIPAGAIQLFVTPGGMTVGDGDREDRYVAVAPNGHILLQMKGISGTVIGYVHRRTGELITPQTLERMQQPRRSEPPPDPSTARSDHLANVTGAR